MADSLASVSSWQVKPGREREFERLGDELMADTEHIEGHISGTVLHEEGSDEYHMVHSFRSREDLRRYLDSPERLDLLKRLEEVAERKGDPQRVTGLEGWFVAAGSKATTVKPPPRWKMAIASFLGAYPLVVFFDWAITPELEDVPLLARAAILPAVLLTLMTYAVMPFVTRLLKRWLDPTR